MQAVFKVQQELKASLGLKKIVVSVNDSFKPNGQKSYVKALRKFGISPTLPGPFKAKKKVDQDGLIQRGQELLTGQSPTGSLVPTGTFLVKVDSDGNTSTVTAEDQQNDLMYLCEVDIGTPPQKLKLDFDTGSADLWVFSTELPSSTQANHGVYDPSKSSTFKKLDKLKWRITYGDGSSASSDVGTDVVSLGGLVVQGQAVELAKSLSDQFAQSTGDGLLGLAFSSINTVTRCHLPRPQPSPMDNLISSKTLPADAQLFTACFYSTRDANKESFYTFGFVDQDLVTASGQEIVWADVDSAGGFWTFPSATATINGQTIQSNGNTAIADTGTTLSLVEDSICEALYKAIPGAKYDDQQQGYVIPTSVTVDQLPVFSVAVGGTEFVIQKEDLVYADVGNGFWYGGVQSRGNNGFDILGDVFLKSVYAIFDQGGNRFGVVPKIEATQNLGNNGAGKK